MKNNSPTQTIVYVFDSLRRDAVGCYDGFASTPNIDSVAADGVKFDEAMSQGIWTVPSSGSIFTGLYPDAHNSSQFNIPLDTGLPRITDGLKNKGVTTACFSTINAISENRGYNKGFDEFYQLGGDGAGLQDDIQDRLHERLHKWIRKNSDDDFFVIVWSLGTHHPYQTPDMDAFEHDISGDQETMRRLPNSQSESVKKMYAETVTYCDRVFGEFLDLLQDEGIYENVFLIVTSDHGEVFTEHARLEHSSNFCHLLSSVLPDQQKRYYGVFDRSAFIGHQGIIPYDELIRVPLVMKPKEEVGEKIVTSQVELIDIAPTVQRVFDMPTREMQGIDLCQLTEGDVSDRKYTYSASQITGGYLTYRSVATVEQKLVSLDFSFPPVNDLADIKVPESIIPYILLKNPMLLDRESGEKRLVKNDQSIDELSNVLTGKIQACQQLHNRLSNQESNIVLQEKTKSHLRDLGYR